MTIDSSPEPVADGGPVASDLVDSGQSKKPAAVTKRDVNALLRSFDAQTVVAPTAAEKERARRLAAWEEGVRKLAYQFDSLAGIHGTPTDAAATLKSLQSASKKGAAAISSLTDSVLVPVEKPARAPRQSTTRTLSESDAQAAVARADEQTPEDGLPDEHPEAESDASLQANNEKAQEPREEEGATAAPIQHRSGPGSRQAPPAPRGDEDPNAGDGF